MVRGHDGGHAGALVMVLELLDEIFLVGGCLALIAWCVQRRLRRLPASLDPDFHRRFGDDGLLLSILAYLGAAIALGTLVRAFNLQTDAVLAGLIVNNGSQLAGILVLIWLVRHKLPGGVGEFFELEHRADTAAAGPNLVLIVLGGAIVAIGVCPLIRDLTAWLILNVVPDYRFKLHPTLEALDAGTLPAARVVALWLGAAVVAPLAEEFFFRGILQRYLGAATRRTGFAIVVSAAAFSTVHFSQPHALPALFFLGLLLGWTFARTGLLAVPIMIHAAFNLKTLIWESVR